MDLPNDAAAIIFDCDGLLVDSETCWTRAETTLFAEHGHGFGPEQKNLLIGKTLPAAGEVMADHFGLPGSGPALAARLSALVAQELATGAEPLPGARNLVESLLGRVPIAVASNSPRAFVDAALITSGLADLFKYVYAVGDVEHGKPAPDLYLAACAGLGADPARCVAFEDSATGVASASAAGLFVIGVPSVPGTTLKAHRSYASLTDPGLLAWADRLAS
ncbi:hypothetical protein ACWT_4320 [Actinoplanes sp. SE50]|uniref:HAD family hydrolase n=1 Tax=unclassified Actinoplanes TaxID=2626549 RepID=UPI00023EC7F8|nr:MULTISPECIES: HAD family phosphatase [unclassified Actinoplanes]AEV85340.1 Enolase-phosphatase E1 [Actinoplanes sp. SE50/110]ATO83735.1 hypothetical protein ACWT_4320 [Actinoplanes sp. SE50]SLM01143.1 uncharacterized protein ACSP50_4376 [Actinoplanes sp. SE50/110]